jgi:hypothetical protein
MRMVGKTWGVDSEKALHCNAESGGSALVKNSIFWFVSLVVASFAAGIGKDVYEDLKTLNWRNSLVTLQNPATVCDLVSFVLPLLLVWIYLRRWEFSWVKVGGALNVVYFGGMAVGYLVTLTLFLLFGNVKPILDDMASHPISKAFILAIAAISIFSYVLRAIVDGRLSKEPLTGSPVLRDD